MSFWTGILWVSLCQLVLTGLYFGMKKRMENPSLNRVLLLGIAVLPMLLWLPLPTPDMADNPIFTVQLPEMEFQADKTAVFQFRPVYLFLPGMLWLLASFVSLMRFISKRRFGFISPGNYWVYYQSDAKTASSFFSSIYLPEDLDDEDRHWMMAHEEVHLKNRHSIDRIVMLLVKSVFWFNPALYLLDRELSLNHEYEADRETLKGADNKTDYQKLMLAHAIGSSGALLHAFSSHRQIKNRILFMNTQTLKRGAYFLFVPLMLLALGWSACNQKESAEEVMNMGQVDDVPEMNGGMDALMQFLMNEIKYPEAMRAEGAEAKVMVSFVVAEDGSIGNVEAFKTEGIQQPFIDEAVRAVSAMPAWTPGKKDGKAVKVKMVLPIVFKL